MPSKTIDDARLTVHREDPPGDGRYVFYWMQASVRTRHNDALEYAVQQANQTGLPLVVGFGLDADYDDATPRSLRFLVDGLIDVAGGLTRRNIGYVVRAGHPLDVAASLAEEAAVVVMDRNYLREPRRWRAELADNVAVRVVEVEANAVVPVETASDKREWAARTIRPKIERQLERFMEELTTTPIDHRDPPDLESLDPTSADTLLEAIALDDVDMQFSGGEHQARAALRRFVEDGLPNYPDAGTVVTGDLSSRLSMYLHYGHISPVAIALAVENSGTSRGARDAYLEELIVRRELANNYVWFERDYDRFTALPEWARTTLAAHRDDDREVTYTAAELERAQTHDRYWNAAMVEMRETGYLHNRMRMYWGKRILDWTNTPEYAFRVALDLNNRHFLDGRDPNSFANVGWLFGLHDQAFAERDIIGKLRPLTRSGLERKVDVDAYIDHVERITGIEIEGS